jgi:hypothetical protein
VTPNKKRRASDQRAIKRNEKVNESFEILWTQKFVCNHPKDYEVADSIMMQRDDIFSH